MAKQQTRMKLLDAAHALFVERGYEAATVREIAAAANLSTGAVFASFNDKADLFNAVLLADYQKLDRLMAAATTEGLPTREALLLLLTVAYDNHLDRLRLVQAALSFSWTDDIRADQGRVEGVGLVLDRLAGVLQQGLQRGELPQRLDVRLTSEMLWDCYVSNYRRAIFDGWEREALRKRLSDQIDVLLCARERKAA
ncbi:MAG: TetR/AcrR family transcriptional regulator [Caulobacteraceae bacterium]|nr:TetR/AcrR family transcriptional regulator [Caulobacteraceae bacterium]